MANDTRTIQEVGKVGEVSTSPRPSKIRTALKRAGRAFASALLVSGLMLSPMRASAEEAKAPQKAGIGVKVGGGYSYLDEQPRAIATVNASVPLPLDASLSGSLGVSSTSKGSAQWEETNLNLDVPIAGPVFIDLYGYNSKHLFIPKLSTGADVGLGFERITAIAGYEHVFDFGTDLAFAVIKVDAIPHLLSLKASGGYTWATVLGSVGAGFTLTPGGWVPELGVHTFALVNKDGAVAIDTVATLGYSF